MINNDFGSTEYKVVRGVRPKQHTDVITPDNPGQIYSYYDSFLNPLREKIYYSRTDNGLNERILQEYNNQVANSISKSANHTLAGDILDQKFINFEESKVGDEFVNFLISQIENVYSKTIKNVYFRQYFWVNKQKRNEYNPRHSHGGVLSFIYYIDVPEKIRNEYKEFIPRGLIQFSSEVTNFEMVFNPRNEDFFLFEAGHIHQVYPFYSDCIRISMSGNIDAIEFEDGEILDDITTKR